VLERPGGASGVTLMASVPAGGDCVGRPCWRAIKGGFRYVDPSASHDGIPDDPAESRRRRPGQGDRQG
jgi:hypothetical protein